MPVDISVLKSKHPLNQLTDHRLTKLSDAGVITEYKHGDVIFSADDNDEMDAFLIWGEIALESTDKKVSSLKHNHDASRFALAKLKPRRYTAKANLNGTCLFWVASALVEQCIAEEDEPLEEDTILVSAPNW